MAGEQDILLFTMTSNACKHTESLISFSLSLLLCVSKSLSAEIYAFSHTPREREAHCERTHFEHHLMASAASLALCLEQWEMFGSSVL